MKLTKITKTDPFDIIDELITQIEANGWTLSQVAKRADISPGAVSKIRRRAVKEPKMSTINKLINAFEDMLQERKDLTGR